MVVYSTPKLLHQSLPNMLEPLVMIVVSVLFIYYIEKGL